MAYVGTIAVCVGSSLTPVHRCAEVIPRQGGAGVLLCRASGNWPWF